jgi:hypothetical protein
MKTSQMVDPSKTEPCGRPSPAASTRGFGNGVVQRVVISENGVHRSSHDPDNAFSDAAMADRHDRRMAALAVGDADEGADQDERQRVFTERRAAADQQQRAAETGAMQGRGTVRQATDALIGTRFNFPQSGAAPDPDVRMEQARMAHINRLRQMFSLNSGSAGHDARTREVGADLLGNMLHNVRTLGAANQARLGEGPEGTDRGRAVLETDDEGRGRFFRSRWGGGGSLIQENPDDPRQGFASGQYGPSWRTSPPGVPDGARHDRAPVQRGLFARLDVVHHSGASPHFDPETHRVSLNETDRLHYAGHELQHAYDHIHGDLNLNDRDQRLHSELNAHRQQRRVADEAHEHLEWRSYPDDQVIGADEQAASYVGKVAKGYTGTMQSSAAAVRDWQQAHPRVDQRARMQAQIQRSRAQAQRKREAKAAQQERKGGQGS